jgi:DNA helicase II / ATP-dependent DNA helicase PcrA
LVSDSLLAGLNPAQREAVTHPSGPLLVLAGAGSGKTRVLTTRITRLISEQGVAPDRILAVTFTNKAAGEMRERIARQLGREPTGMWMGTFHAIGARIVRRAAHQLHRTPSFTIYDEDEQLAVIKRLMERHKIPPKQFAPRAIRAAISDAKNALVSVEEYSKLARDPFAQAVALVYNDLESAFFASLSCTTTSRWPYALPTQWILMISSCFRCGCWSHTRKSSQNGSPASTTSSWTSTRTRTARSTGS